MDKNVHVPNLGGRIVTSSSKKSDPSVPDGDKDLTFPSWIKTFGHEITLICVFVLILLLIYHVSSESISTSHAVKRRQARMKKAFCPKKNSNENLLRDCESPKPEEENGSSDQDD